MLAHTHTHACTHTHVHMPSTITNKQVLGSDFSRKGNWLPLQTPSAYACWSFPTPPHLLAVCCISHQRQGNYEIHTGRQFSSSISAALLPLTLHTTVLHTHTHTIYVCMLHLCVCNATVCGFTGSNCSLHSPPSLPLHLKCCYCC